MQMPGRSYSSPDYRYSFNGMEKDDEIKGNGNILDFGARMYDPRIGKWFSVDAFTHEAPSWTPYRFAFNNPIYWVDNDGNREFPSYAAYVDYAKENKLKVLSEYDIYQQGHWLWLHRIRYQEGAYEKRKAAVFANAAKFNTNNIGSGEYHTVSQRLAYYSWTVDHFHEKGQGVRWFSAAKSAVINIDNAVKMGRIGYFISFGNIGTNENIKRFLEAGNKIILDDVMPRIKELMNSVETLTGEAARNWDAQTLSNEQNVIQPLYESMLDEDDIELVTTNLKLLYGDSWNDEWDVTNAKHRWTLGMREMGYSDAEPEDMPTPTN